MNNHPEINWITAPRCARCPAFSADATDTTMYADGIPYMTQTTIDCAHRRICDALLDMIEKGVIKGDNYGKY